MLFVNLCGGLTKHPADLYTGISIPASILFDAPVLTETIKESGLVLFTYGEENSDPEKVAEQFAQKVSPAPFWEKYPCCGHSRLWFSKVRACVYSTTLRYDDPRLASSGPLYTFKSCCIFACFSFANRHSPFLPLPYR